MKPKLTINLLIEEARAFCIAESKQANEKLFGVTDGKKIGTYIEHEFKKHLSAKYEVTLGSSASGIDFPSDDIKTDIKVTSVNKPQSSSPFKNARQKIFGLKYNLLVFVYLRRDEVESKTTNLNFVGCYFVSEERTSDYKTTLKLRQMVDDNETEAAIIAFLKKIKIPAEESELSAIAKEILANKPKQGYLTNSNAMQWRLKYQRIVDLNMPVDGITKVV